MLEGNFIDKLGNFSNNNTVPDIFAMVVEPWYQSMGAELFYTVMAAATISFIYFKTGNVAIPAIITISVASMWLGTFVPEISTLMVVIVALVLASIIYILYNRRSS